ncbi:MAG: aminopeptidase [Planctomycetota bacterium]|nr:aminopeptidase [Planctomycetota bacterium]
MNDPRLLKLADVIVQHCTSVQPGDLVRISGSPLTEPLLSLLYKKVLEAGGHPMVSMAPENCAELLLAHGTDDQIRYENPVAQFETETIDVAISLWGQQNSKALTAIAPEKQGLRSQARKKLLGTFLDRAASKELRWCGTQFPCHSSAQDAEMSLADYQDFVFRGGLLHLEDPAAAWQQISVRQQRLVDYLTGTKEIHFVTPQGTDLRLDVTDRTWINCDGRENFPDGEVFTGPVETGTEGTVSYSFPAVHGGREVEDIQLVFEAGKVVQASASKGEAFLHSMLDQDPGARILGEIAIGTNYAITQYTKNTLFDEKIGGTFHAALGAAYPESGGTNESALHWDMVCDLRNGGQIFVDGKLISENGRFLDADWPHPS